MGKEGVKEPVDPASLARAAAEQSFVRVKRSTGDSIDGLIVGVTPRWTAMAVLADTIDLDGYALIRTPSVRRIKPLERRAQFVRDVLQARDQWPPKPLPPFERQAQLVRDVRQARDQWPPKPLRPLEEANDETLIRVLSTSFPLMSVYTEGEHPDECYIGRPREVTTETVTLDEVDPSGRWLLAPTTYRLAKVTRIGVGGRYEEALQTVAAVSRPSGGSRR